MVRGIITEYVETCSKHAFVGGDWEHAPSPQGNLEFRIFETGFAGLSGIIQKTLHGPAVAGSVGPVPLPMVVALCS